MTTAEVAIGLIAAIRGGDLDALQRLLDEHPGLATSRLGGAGGGRTPLHVVTDWPGFFPNGPEAARLLIGAGADVDSRGDDEEHGETPLTGRQVATMPRLLQSSSAREPTSTCQMDQSARRSRMP